MRKRFLHLLTCSGLAMLMSLQLQADDSLECFNIGLKSFYVFSKGVPSNENNWEVHLENDTLKDVSVKVLDSMKFRTEKLGVPGRHYKISKFQEVYAVQFRLTSQSKNIGFDELTGAPSRQLDADVICDRIYDVLTP